MAIELYPHQREALKRMHNGCILNGGVGSGKSMTSLAYYYFKNGGIYDNGMFVNEMVKAQDLYIITTARKRDDNEWDGELARFLLSRTKPNHKNIKIVVDSWNNISKYVDVVGAFFIFDEQRVVGSGAWVKSFIKITKANEWILLSATPGDTWSDYIPVFIANGFYKNRTEFTREHIVFSRFSKFPKVDRYLGTAKLNRLRRDILVDMDFKRKTEQHHINIMCEYPIGPYKDVMKNRWSPTTDAPIVNASELCYELRKMANSDESRRQKCFDIVKEKQKCIIFYNFDYELEILHDIFDPIDWLEVAEWNGHKHQAVPISNNWVYLVQYTAGAEGWNCITTDTIIFFSQNYSYKIMMQAAGRIDRLNTMYRDLYYYHLKSYASIDLAIAKALKEKRKFNESTFAF